MTQSQLDCAVADATGESVHTIAVLGFSIACRNARDLEPEDVQLILDCPFCGHVVQYPGCSPDDSPQLAECLACDVYFDWSVEEIYTAERRQACA
jgi:hypothetical protein